MAKHTRWVQYDVPLLVRVDLHDEYLDEEVTQVVLAIPDLDTEPQPPLHGIALARDHRGQFLVYDGDPGAEMTRVQDPLADRAINAAETRSEWPARNAWEEDTNPRRDPGLYDSYLEADDEDEHDDEDLPVQTRTAVPRPSQQGYGQKA
ncbi:hypothetical protein [Kribbella solani]|uniref:Uncharacterized protein n=1 Tax=Kribbella solani TaxID=236067 RepID=A0A841DZE3_9ACTN|nr:hypothetical protein [Kribbella solani]MBB5984012.1 hypothetical protein [Kribbella solani]